MESPPSPTSPSSQSDPLKKRDQKNRGRSCSAKLKSGRGRRPPKNRHRSVSLSPPLIRDNFRRSSHRIKTGSARMRGVSLSPPKHRERRQCQLRHSTGNVLEGSASMVLDGWTEVPELVLMGFGFPKLA
mmetsp:Transcript_3624/g.7193  ORF Transcript_3624/g.7193 Transcript_3624/m.7193 type:complete len:129 (+) Transcript_3624:115-501(+)